MTQLTGTKLSFPPFLKAGDQVAIVSPSSKIDPYFLKGAKARLESWGLRVRMGKHAAAASGPFAGDLRSRLADLQQAMDDPHVAAILCSRGGYGAVQLLSRLDFRRFRERAKWLMGYSDITALHCLFQRQGFASIHSLMARHLTVEPADDLCTAALRDLLFGQPSACAAPPCRLNRTGHARGVLRGGNLAVACGLRGTPYDIPPEGTVLFIEDVNERPHAVDRMMYNLKLGGVLEKLSALVVGQFTGYDDGGVAERAILESIAAAVAEYAYPVCFDFPVGHVSRNFPLIEGAEVELDVSRKGTQLRYAGL